MNRRRTLDDIEDIDIKQALIDEETAKIAKYKELMQTVAQYTGQKVVQVRLSLEANGTIATMDDDLVAAAQAWLDGYLISLTDAASAL